MFDRDGYLTSLWQATTAEFINQSSGTQSVYDVIIVGAGMTGITTGLELQKLGHRCLILEAHSPGFGTTGGTTAHLNTLLDNPYSTIKDNFGFQNAKLIYQAVEEAMRKIRDNIAEHEIDCGFEYQSAWMYAEDETELKQLKIITDASAAAGVDIKWTSELPVNVHITGAIEAKGQAKFHPIRYLMALATEFMSRGGVIMQNSLVNDISESESGVTATSDNGKWEARHLILATHIPPGINLIHLRCAPYRSYAIACRLNDDAYPEGLVYDMKEPYNYFRTQMIDGENFLIAGGADKKTGHAKNELQQLREVEANARKLFNIKEVSYRWSSQYYESTDGLPYIGVLPGSQGRLLVATGFGGNGMMYSHVAARILSDKIVGKASELGELLAPGRIKPVAGFSNFISHNADVMKEFIAKLVPKEKIENLIELAPGEGKVVDFESEKLAIYKDPDGNIHSIRPTCTHMKCEVSFNNAECTWDCPCHGARFSPDGTVVTGPAMQPLPRIDIE